MPTSRKDQTIVGPNQHRTDALCPDVVGVTMHADGCARLRPHRISRYRRGQRVPVFVLFGLLRRGGTSRDEDGQSGGGEQLHGLHAYHPTEHLSTRI
ncbi:hypothetical protein [Mycobacteroides abscessus]|uniref:Uncharacterized protein n=1 Tax=Mycobacteroides abscessus TaxID=36809 RepID=A0ABD7HFH8_9MYCO|nr:hypothetical protein [Mycobacteroides abscessus]RIT26262.1 hypothetical protein D2E76_28430 [Mycobacteroides abscessus]